MTDTPTRSLPEPETTANYVQVGPSTCFKCHAVQHPGSRAAIVYRLGLAAAAWLAEVESLEEAGEGYSVAAMLNYAEMAKEAVALSAFDASPEGTDGK